MIVRPSSVTFALAIRVMKDPSPERLEEYKRGKVLRDTPVRVVRCVCVYIIVTYNQAVTAARYQTIPCTYITAMATYGAVYQLGQPSY